jgi:membrane protein DedA with SNARE-associated domain
VDAVVIALMLATATADRWSTLLILFVGTALSWVGVPAIGAAAMGAAGVLASQGTLHLWSVLVIGVAAAELGGIAGWWLGRWLAQRPTGHEGRLAAREARALATGHRLEERVGGVMVFFVPSWVSGSLGMSPRRFASWNLVASTLWALATGLGAYGLGSVVSGSTAERWLVPLLVAAAAIGALAYAFVHWRRHVARAAAAELGAEAEPA